MQCNRVSCGLLMKGPASPGATPLPPTHITLGALIGAELPYSTRKRTWAVPVYECHFEPHRSVSRRSIDSTDGGSGSLAWLIAKSQANLAHCSWRTTFDASR